MADTLKTAAADPEAILQSIADEDGKKQRKSNRAVHPAIMQGVIPFFLQPGPLAELFGISQKTLDRWLEEDPDAPEPVTRNKKLRLYSVEEVKAWFYRMRDRQAKKFTA